ncbi:MAG: preprotein translocase subunit SecA [Ekhidna sp.]
MLNSITKGIAKVFGTKTERDLKGLTPFVALINAEYSKLTNITDDALRERTTELKGVISERLKSIDDKIAGLKTQVEEDKELDVHQKEAIFAEMDGLEKSRDEELEKVLIDILPQAFAVVKETSRRLSQNEKLVVRATQHDKEIAARKQNVEVSGETATWHNKWLAAGTEVVWNMLHYDVQLIGGVALHQGKIAEMATGEGKTLVATLPAYLNALAERGVHIVTVNDYLARRDSEWNAPIFEFHGLRVDCIDNHQPNSQERRNAYMADITYGTNNEFGFDYLRDNMSRSPEELVQKKHHYAMVDEVDSVLIDDARTPLIISGPIPKGDEHEFYDLKPRIQRLVEAQRKLVGEYLNEAKKFMKDGNEAEAGLPLFRAYRGMPKYKPLIKFMSEAGVKQLLQKTENIYLADNQKKMPEADEPLYFTIDEKINSNDMTDRGLDLITGSGEDPNFFILPDIGVEIDALEKDSSKSESDILQEKEGIIRDYSLKAQRIHSVNQLLKAYCMYEKDTEYLVMDGKVKIVDEQTGRVMEGRRYSDGLHQAIEAKENVKVEDATQTYATVTLQNYFRMYHKLAGMTGTAETEAGEFWDIYELDVVVIPTNRPIARQDDNDKVYKTIREKFNAVADEVVELTKAGRPVLVGTTSVEISELLSRMLKIKNINHQVLNAKQHAKEADVVAEAGKPGAVTIATNMAGRGTDIKLSDEVKAAGGLAIIGTERHESRRVDRQLRGRSGRQGDPGSSQFYVSLEDNLMRLFMSDRVAKIMDKLGLQEGEVIQHSMITKSIERAQKKVEENNFAVRKNLLEYDDVMNSQREVIYKRRRNALYGERLELDVLSMLSETTEDIAFNAKAQLDLDSLKLNAISILGLDFQITKEEFEKMDENTLSNKLYDDTLANYKKKNGHITDKALPILKQLKLTRGATLENVLVPFTDGKKQIGTSVNLERAIETEGAQLVLEMEKMIALATIDHLWKEHLREMDDLRQSVRNAAYEQKDPLLIYKFEGFEMFKRFVGKVNEETVSFLMKSEIPVQEADDVQAAQQQKTARNYKEQKEESRSALSGGAAPQGNRPPAQQPTSPVQTQKIASRNQRVNVQYSDGQVKKDVKYKTVEEDIKSNKCVLID